MDAQIKNPDLADRLKTAAILIFIVVLFGMSACYSAFAAKVFAALALLVVLAAGLEFCWLRSDSAFISRLFSSCCLLLPAVCTYFLAISRVDSVTITGMLPSLLMVLFLFGAALFWIECISSKEEAGLEKFSVCVLCRLLAFLLLALGGSSLLLLAMFRPAAALILIFLVAFADSSAYFAGCKIGGPKIAAIVSPKKTVAGTAAALILTSLISAVCFRVLSVELPLFLSMLTGFLVALASQAGDFAKSVIKRNSGIKDFSALLPGHGGVFDRIDGLLGAAPLFLIISVYIWHF